MHESDRLTAARMGEDLMKKRGKDIAIDLLVDVVAGFLIAIGTYNFAAAMGFPMAGLSGIALVLYYLFHTPIGLVSGILNLPIAIGTYKLLGRRFFIDSIKTMIIGYIIMDLVAPLMPVYSGDRLLAAICSGVFCGIGYGLIFMRGSSTGGMDFIFLAIQKKHPHLTLGTISFVSDAIIILLGAAIAKTGIDGVIYGMIITFILTTVLDKVMFGANAKKFAIIVTDKEEEITVAIDTEVERGSTLLQAEGGHTGSPKAVVMCACSNKQLYQVRALVRRIDPEAFMIMMDSNEVAGEGFRRL